MLAFFCLGSCLGFRLARRTRGKAMRGTIFNVKRSWYLVAEAIALGIINWVVILAFIALRHGFITINFVSLITALILICDN